jgi:hypothetical protein
MRSRHFTSKREKSASFFPDFEGEYTTRGQQWVFAARMATIAGAKF